MSALSDALKRTLGSSSYGSGGLTYNGPAPTTTARNIDLKTPIQNFNKAGEAFFRNFAISGSDVNPNTLASSFVNTLAPVKLGKSLGKTVKLMADTRDLRSTVDTDMAIANKYTDLALKLNKEGKYDQAKRMFDEARKVTERMKAQIATGKSLEDQRTNLQREIAVNTAETGLTVLGGHALINAPLKTAASMVGLPAALGGVMSKLSGRPIAEGVGSGVASGIMYQGLGTLTNPIINVAGWKAADAMKLSPIVNNVVQRVISGAGNVAEDELMGAIEKKKPEASQKLFSFVLGMLMTDPNQRIRGWADLPPTTKTLITQAGEKLGLDTTPMASIAKMPSVDFSGKISDEDKRMPWAGAPKFVDDIRLSVERNGYKDTIKNLVGSVNDNYNMGLSTKQIPLKDSVAYKDSVLKAMAEKNITPEEAEMLIDNPQMGTIGGTEGLKNTIINKIKDLKGEVLLDTTSKDGYTTINSTKAKIGFKELPDTIEITGIYSGDESAKGQPTEIVQAIKDYAASKNKTVTATQASTGIDYWKKMGFEQVDVPSKRGGKIVNAVWKQPTEQPAEQLSMEWKNPNMQTVFERAMMQGNKKTVKQLLPMVPEGYKQKMKGEIETLLGQPLTAPIQPIIAKKIVGQEPNISPKSDVEINDVEGNPIMLPKGETFTPHLTSDNKVVLKDGGQYVVDKATYNTLKGQSVQEVAKPFAPELDMVDEKVYGFNEKATNSVQRFNELDAQLRQKYKLGEDSTLYQLRSKLTNSEGKAFDAARKAAQNPNTEKELEPLFDTPELRAAGDRYREIVLTIPKEKPSADIEWKKSGNDLTAEYGGLKVKISKKGDIYTVSSSDGQVDWISKTEEAAKKTAQSHFDKLVPDSPAFHSKTLNFARDNQGKSYLDPIDNAIGHIRVSEQSTADGKRGLLLDEYESEWADAVKSGGKKTPNVKIEAVPAKADDTSELRYYSVMKPRSVDPDTGLGQLTFIKAYSPQQAQIYANKSGDIIAGDSLGASSIEPLGRKITTYKGKEYLVSSDGTKNFILDGTKEPVIQYRVSGDGINGTTFASLDEANKFATRSVMSGEPVPSHPLLNKAEDLTLRRGIKEAVDNGYDYLLLSTPEEQIKRSQLTNLYKGLTWDTLKDGSEKTVRVEPLNQEPFNITVDRWGNITNTSASEQTNRLLVGADLGEAVGTSAKNKIMALGKGELQGKDMDIAGTGLKNKYGDSLIKKIEDITGEKVEEIPVGDGSVTRKGIKITPELKAKVLGIEPSMKTPSGIMPSYGETKGGEPLRATPDQLSKTAGAKPIPIRGEAGRFNGSKAGEKPYVEQGLLTTKTLAALEGKTTVTKQEIIRTMDNLSQWDDLSKTERKIINATLDEFNGDKIKVADFAEMVKGQLVPLNNLKMPNPTWSDYGVKVDVLGDDYGKGVYDIIIHESPYNIQGVTTHFPKYENYFGHTREYNINTEGISRKIILELQSDITQGGEGRRINDAIGKATENYEKYFGNMSGSEIGDFVKNPVKYAINDIQQNAKAANVDVSMGGGKRVTLNIYKMVKAAKDYDQLRENINQFSPNDSDKIFTAMANTNRFFRDYHDTFSAIKEGRIAQVDTNVLKGLAKIPPTYSSNLTGLQRISAQYENPTGIFRQVREDIKRAADEGYSEILFPAGKTIARIENYEASRPPEGPVEGGVPEDTVAGNYVEYEGQEHIALEDAGGAGEWILAVPNNQRTNKFDFDQYKSEEADYEAENMSSDPADYETDIENYLSSTEKGQMDDEGLAKVADLMDKKGLDLMDAIDEVGTDKINFYEVAEQMIEDRMPTIDDAVQYLNDMGDGNKYAAAGDSDIVSYDPDDETTIYVNDVVDNSDWEFDPDSLDDDQRVVYNVYETKLREYLKKLYPNMEIYRNSEGMDWYRIKINKGMKAPVKAFGIVGGMALQDMIKRAQEKVKKEEEKSAGGSAALKSAQPSPIDYLSTLGVNVK